MLIKKKLKNGKTSVTSSYFEDARLVKQSLSESKQDDYVSKKWRKEAPRDFKEIEWQTAIMVIQLVKQGAREVSTFASLLADNQIGNYVLNYGPLKDYESYDELVAKRDSLKGKILDKEMTKELERVNREIKAIDDFAAQNLERVKNTNE